MSKTLLLGLNPSTVRPFMLLLFKSLWLPLESCIRHPSHCGWHWFSPNGAYSGAWHIFLHQLWRFTTCATSRLETLSQHRSKLCSLALTPFSLHVRGMVVSKKWGGEISVFPHFPQLINQYQNYPKPFFLAPPYLASLSRPLIFLSSSALSLFSLPGALHTHLLGAFRTLFWTHYFPLT